MNYEAKAAESIRRHREFAAKVRDTLWAIAIVTWMWAIAIVTWSFIA